MSKTMTLNLPEAEMVVLTTLATAKGLSKTGVLRQALRLYQMVNVRHARGERLIFEGDDRREMVALLWTAP